MLIDGEILVPFAVALTVAALWVLNRRGLPAWRLLVVALFAIYLTGVALETLFPIVVGPERGEASIALHDVVHLKLFEGMVNSPLARQQSFLNVMLGVPLGIFLPLLGVRSAWKAVALGLVFGLSIEGLQLVEDLAYHSEYRTVDVNDVALNWLGVAIGVAVYFVAAGAFRWWLGGRPRGVPQRP